MPRPGADQEAPARAPLAPLAPVALQAFNDHVRLEYSERGFWGQPQSTANPGAMQVSMYLNPNSTNAPINPRCDQT